MVAGIFQILIAMPKDCGSYDLAPQQKSLVY
jgi:hypothetical protein